VAQLHDIYVDDDDDDDGSKTGATQILTEQKKKTSDVTEMALCNKKKLNTQHVNLNKNAN